MKLYHLFPDLMDLYGDRGNLLVLRQRLTQQGQEAEIVPLRPGESPDLSQAGLLYAGPGTEPALQAALEHLRPLLPALREALAGGVPMLFTGNSWLCLGQSLTTPDGQSLEGLGLLDFQVTQTRERYTHDAIALPQADGLPQSPTVGFQNRCDQVTGVERPLFTMEMGAGNCPGSPLEGLRDHNLLATHLIGPLLVKNPHLLDYVSALLGGQPQTPADPEAALAYQVTLEALRARRS